MNRAQRRALERAVRHRQAPTRRTFTLRGGPMDGVIVTPDAPALSPDWWAGYVEGKALGAYRARQRELELDPDNPGWPDLSDEDRAPFRAWALAEYGAGRYELATRRSRDGIRYASWRRAAID